MQDGQVTETLDGQEQSPVEQVEETPVVEQIGQLLNQEETVKEKETPETIPEKPQETIPEPEVVESKEAVIDDAITKDFPTLKMYLGKPLKDIPKAYHNLVLAYKKDHEELIKLKQEIANKEIPKPDDFPDPIEKPEDFKKALADYAEQIRKQALSEARNQPEQYNLAGEVAKGLPEGTDVNDVLNQFTQFNTSRFYDQFGNLRPELQVFYESNPEVLRDEILSFYRLYSTASKSKTIIAKESKDTAYKTITNSIKKAQENKEDLQGTQFNAVSRSEITTAEDEMLAKIFNIAQGNNP